MSRTSNVGANRTRVSRDSQRTAIVRCRIAAEQRIGNVDETWRSCLLQRSRTSSGLSRATIGLTADYTANA
jgi:hypothetical protein